MKFTLVLLSLIATYASAQSYSRQGSSSRLSSSCECTQVRTLTGQDYVVGGQRDGTQSVCLFSPFGFKGQVSFEGGWHITGDLVRYECSGGVAGTGRITHGSELSPLCRITSTKQEIARADFCVHQSDLNHDNRISAEEQAAWVVKNTPITEGPEQFVGKVSRMAIDYWSLTFSLAISGSNLCDRSYRITEPQRYEACVATPFACRRLNFVKAVNPLMSEQIKSAYSGFSNNLDHCE